MAYFSDVAMLLTDFFEVFLYFLPFFLVGLLTLIEGHLFGRAREDMLVTKLLNIVIVPLAYVLVRLFMPFAKGDR